MTVDRNRLAALAAEPHFYRGRYRNLEPVPRHGIGDFMRWQLAPGRNFPKGKRFTLLRRDTHSLMSPPEEPQLVWLGHASFLFQYRGLNVLTDPVLSERASPFQLVGPKRYTPPALTVADMPPIQLVLISHNHYDHLDENTVRQLHRRFGDNLRFCIPRGLKQWFEKRGIHNLVELDWWQSEPLSGNRPSTSAAGPPQIPTPHSGAAGYWRSTVSGSISPAIPATGESSGKSASCSRPLIWRCSPLEPTTRAGSWRRCTWPRKRR